MSSSEPTPYLLISLSSEPEQTSARHYLTHEVTLLGRPEPEEAGPASIDLPIDWISRRHARIVRRPEGWLLENWNGSNGIGVYERTLHPGDAHALRHGDNFRIPDLSESYARILFLIDDRKTLLLPLHIDQKRREVRVFGALVPCRGLEYRLLLYLFRRAGEICSYDEILAHLWPDYQKVDGRRAELDVYLSRLRGRLREASGGFTFMQTICGHGVRLVI